VTTRFPGDAEIGASSLPFRAVRRNPPAAGPKLREQMGQLVAQSAINFNFSVRTEPAIEQDPRGPEFGATRGAAQTRRPFHLHPRGQRCGSVLGE